MTTECTFCSGTKIEPGQTDCVWCDNTGKHNGIDYDRKPADQVARYTAVQLRFATGDLGNAEFIDAKLFDALKVERDSLKAQLDQCQARRRQFAEEVNGRLNVLEERAAELEPLLGNLRKAHEFKAICLADRETADATGATRDAYEWCRTAGDDLAAHLIKPTTEAESHE